MTLFCLSSRVSRYLTTPIRLIAHCKLICGIKSTIIKIQGIIILQFISDSPRLSCFIAMSNTPQRMRNRTDVEGPATKSLIKSGNWSKSFPTKFSTETSSCVFVKKLLTVAISNITYLRSMFPESSYANRSMDGLPLKILKGKNECAEAQSLANWLMGAFDALEKKYLRELMLIVYEDPSNPDIVQEMYTFRFSYPDGQAACEMFQGEDGKVVNNVSTDDIYRSTQNMLRTLVVLTQGLAPMSDSMMTMKLTYYDAVTPGDYEPAGFIPTPLVEPQLPNGTASLQSGKVETNYHSVQLGVKAVAGQKRVEQTGQAVELVEEVLPDPVHRNADPVVSQGVVSSVLPSSAPALSQPPLSSSLIRKESLLNPPSSARSQALSPVSLLSEQSEENSSNINCLCLNHTTDPMMLVCSFCSSLQHAACYRIVSEDMAPAQHCCVSCSIVHGVPCTDTKLVKMSTNPAVTLTCLFRRVLACLLVKDRVTLEDVMDKLGVEEGTADAVLKKLAGEEGLAKEGADWVVQREKFVDYVLPRYMGKGLGKKKQDKGTPKMGGKRKKNESVLVVGTGVGNEEAETDILEIKIEMKKETGCAGDGAIDKEKKCSTVVKPNYINGDKERVPIKGGEDGGSSRRCKRRKVSEVKENLSI